MLTRQLMVDRWMSHILTCGIFWANGMVPHGPVMDCHMTPLRWLLWKKFHGLHGILAYDLRSGQISLVGPGYQPAHDVTCKL
jgi:hypothetical protein